MMEKQELQLLKGFERDSQWFHENVDKLREQNFTGKFVAIANEKPVASDRNIDIVIRNVEQEGKNPAYVFIEFVHPKGFTLLL
ncbi:MAG: hypothetical protein KKB21_05355 [Nanoarchaeota archaeon]|nr:hypothetical protein [Nanoarchaeota archaeon]MBU4086974.1 hypothetical protein [Nanoarchaeota archaeon]